MICLMDRLALNKLEQCTAIQQQLTVDSSFANGTVETRVRSLDGIPIKAVPTARIMSAITLSATDGYSRPANAMQINWVICPSDVPMAIRRSELPKIIQPANREFGNAWFLGYFLYHGFLMLDNKLSAVYVSYTPISAPTLAITITKPVTTGKTKWSPDVALGTGETLAYKMQAGAGSDLYNDIPTGATAYTAGTEINATAGQHMLCYQLDSVGHIVKYVDHTLASGDIGTGI
jgi:hypothetical protein